MKTFKAMCATMVLALSLSVSTFADPPNPGDGHSPGSAAPAPTSIEPIEIASTDGTAEGDLNLLTLDGLLWVVASIY
jgi:hypothetical protein